MSSLSLSLSLYVYFYPIYADICALYIDDSITSHCNPQAERKAEFLVKRATAAEKKHQQEIKKAADAAAKLETRREKEASERAAAARDAQQQAVLHDAMVTAAKEAAHKLAEAAKAAAMNPVIPEGQKTLSSNTPHPPKKHYPTGIQRT